MLRDMKNAVDGTIAIGDHVIALYNEDECAALAISWLMSTPQQMA